MGGPVLIAESPGNMPWQGLPLPTTPEYSHSHRPGTPPGGPDPPRCQLQWPNILCTQIANYTFTRHTRALGAVKPRPSPMVPCSGRFIHVLVVL